MFDNTFFDQWLDEEAQRVQERIKTSQPLDADDKVLLILKAQVNHFHHLDIELREEVQTLRLDMDKRFDRMDQRFEQVDRRFEQVDKRFEQMRTDMDKRFEQTQEELKKLYQAINTQTWKMIGAIGLIVILTRLAGDFHLAVTP